MNRQLICSVANSALVALLCLPSPLLINAANARTVSRSEQSTEKKIIVAADGSGDFKSLADGIKAVCDSKATIATIRLKPGTYTGPFMVPKTTTHITLLGDDVKTTIISYDRNMNDPIPAEQPPLYRGNGFVVLADDFRAENITFRNISGDHGQAMALRADGDREVFLNCRMLGWQDTLMVNNGRQYFGSCYIEGRVDFIYGSATAVFDRCEIHSKNGGHVTAASTPQDRPYGYVFLHCHLTGDPEPWKDPAGIIPPKTSNGPVRADLGRPWRPYGAVAYIECQMEDHIKPEGWNNWGKEENEKTARYSEYRSKGPGANPDKRVAWSKQLTDEEAKNYTTSKILAGSDNWQPPIVSDKKTTKHTHAADRSVDIGSKQESNAGSKPEPKYESNTGSVNVRAFGAAGDGKKLETLAFARAISACEKAGGGTVVVPPGKYLTGTIVLRSHITLDISAGATLIASENPDDYPLEPDAYEPTHMIRSPLINAHDAENITLTGRGTIDGRGAIWWRRLELFEPKRIKGRTLSKAEQAEGMKVANGRPHLIRFVRCKDVLIERLHLKDSPEWNVHPTLCEFVRVDGLIIEAAEGSHNTDGINPESCRNVQISNCRIDTGDDCVTLKSGKDELGRKMGRPDENITIQNCVMLRGHGGVTIGSEMSGGVRNVTVTNCVFQGTDIGIRIKSQRGRGGVVEGLTVSNIVMQDVPHPFTITTFYNGKDKPTDTFPLDEGTPRFRDFVFSNITARGAKDAGSITGLKEMPVSQIVFTNVLIQAQTGFTCTNAQDIRFNECRFTVANGPVLLLNEATASGLPAPANQSSK